ncbi:MAG: PD-(D/E)XK nuclease family transposase [Clostridium butyricum]|nr:PD-(D/E)XK nuclease family transposase [Clostridium butyricum]MDU5804296.1 PD-(D/E)XK nuclease family transposase [Fusobacterium periodonticum]
MIRGLLDPKIDFIFKNIFGAEKNKRILISFLNSVLKNSSPIKTVEIKLLRGLNFLKIQKAKDLDL